jgi:hypothetical protein
MPALVNSNPPPLRFLFDTEVRVPRSSVSPLSALATQSDVLCG